MQIHSLTVDGAFRKLDYPGYFKFLTPTFSAFSFRPSDWFYTSVWTGLYAKRYPV